MEHGDAAGVFNMDPTMIREAGECALRSYYILLGALNGYVFNGQTLSYQGNFGVGYLVMKFNVTRNGSDKSNDSEHRILLNEIKQQEEKQFSKRFENQNPYVRLAWESLIHYLIHGYKLNIPLIYTRNER